MRRWLRKLVAVVRKRPLDEELREELDAHIEMLTEDNIAAGMEPAAARRSARLTVGNPAVAEELHRDARGLPTLESFLQDLRYAYRTLTREWSFTVVAVAILGIGIGANTVVYSLVDALVLQPLPFTQPDRLVWIANGEPGATNPSLLASRVLTFEGWREASTQLDELAAFSPFFTRDSWALTGDGKDPERVKGVLVTDNFLPLLGVPLDLGRSFTPEEVAVGGPQAVIVSHSLWERRFESDVSLVGRPIEINDAPVTVVGILPADFDFGSAFAPGYDVDLLFPALLERMSFWGNTLSVVGRMGPDATLASTAAELEALTTNLRQERPELEGWVVFARTSALQDHVNGPVRGALWLLWGAVGMVLLIVCANLANLMLVRGVARRRELAVRAALGAGRGRLMRQLLTESFVLSLLGVTLGVGLAVVGLRTIVARQAVVLPLLERVRIDGSVLAVTGTTALLVALVVGLVPALQLARRDGLAALGQSSRGAVGDRAEHWTRASLVVAEIALACTLLVGAGLLVRSFGHLLDVELGFEPSQRASFQVSAGARYTDSAEVVSFHHELGDTLRAVPGVNDVAFTDNLPLDGNRSWGLRRADDPDATSPTSAFVRFVSEGYFEAMGVDLLTGRGFTRDDTDQSEAVIVINDTLARTLWPGSDPIDEAVLLGDTETRVVGVVEDVRHNSLDEESGAEMYLPMARFGLRNFSVVVHTDGDPRALTGQLRSALREVDPRLPFTDFRPLDRLVDRAVSSRRFFMSMLTSFAGMALLLASLGIYGVISYSVGQRRAEIGVRLALGAQPGRVLGEEMRRGLRLTGIGLAIGIVGAVAASRLLQTQLYQVGATDPTTYALMAAVLLAVAMFAGYLPARRAARTNPVQALRDGA